MNRSYLFGALVAGTVLTGIGYAVFGGAQAPSRLHEGVRHRAVEWQANPPQAARRCRSADVVLTDEALVAYQLDTERTVYGHLRECAAPSAGVPFKVLAQGSEVAEKHGLEIIEASVRLNIDYQPGWPRVELWLARGRGADGGSAAPHSCACGPGCIQRRPDDAGVMRWQLTLAPYLVHQPGQWREPPDANIGACEPAPCGALAGVEVELPEACCTTQCEGKACGEGACGDSCGSCGAGEHCVGYACVPLPPGPDASAPDEILPPDAGE